MITVFPFICWSSASKMGNEQQKNNSNFVLPGKGGTGQPELSFSLISSSPFLFGLFTELTDYQKWMKEKNPKQSKLCRIQIKLITNLDLFHGSTRSRFSFFLFNVYSTHPRCGRHKFESLLEQKDLTPPLPENKITTKLQFQRRRRRIALSVSFLFVVHFVFWKTSKLGFLCPRQTS